MNEEVKSHEHVGMFATEVIKKDKSPKLMTNFYCLFVDGGTKASLAEREKAPVTRG